MAVKPTAFLLHENDIYYSESTQNPIGQILEYVWFHEPDSARRITRNRIYTHLPPSPLCLGMVKVAGKRFTIIENKEFIDLFEIQKSGKSLIHASSINCFWDYPLSKIEQPLDDGTAMETAIKLSERSTSKIAALLIDENKKIVSWGWNDHFKNRVLHAEFMLVKNYVFQFQQNIPKNHTLVTTLLPCAMCAGYLFGHSQDFESLKIIYLNNDPGPFAQNSILMKNSHLHHISGISAVPRLQKHKAPTTS